MQNRATDAPLWALALLAFCLPSSIAGVNVALFALTLALGYLWFLRVPLCWSSWRNPVVFALILYGGVGILASFFGFDLANSSHDWRKDFHKVWVAAALLLAIPEPCASAEAQADAGTRTAFLFRFAALGFALVSVVGIGQMLGHLAQGVAFRNGRAHGFAYAVTYGDMLGLGVLGGFSLWFSGKEMSARENAGLHAFLLLTLSALFCSGTRAALLGVAAGYVCLALLQGSPGQKKRKGLIPIAAWGVLLGALIFLSFQLRAESLTAGPTAASLGSGPAADSVDIHKAMWGIGLRMFRDHPLLGVGPGNYRLLVPRYFPGHAGGYADWSVAHNMYIEALAERGLAGFSALLLVFAALALTACRKLRQSPSFPRLWSLSAVAAFAVMNLTETAFQSEQTMTLLLFIWALGQAADVQ